MSFLTSVFSSLEIGTTSGASRHVIGEETQGRGGSGHIEPSPDRTRVSQGPGLPLSDAGTSVRFLLTRLGSPPPVCTLVLSTTECRHVLIEA